MIKLISPMHAMVWLPDSTPCTLDDIMHDSDVISVYNSKYHVGGILVNSAV